MNNSKLKGGVVLLVFSILLMTTFAYAAGDAAYIYKKDFRIDQNIVDKIESFGFNVDLIQEEVVNSTNFSQYDFVFINDEAFSDPEDIPIGEVHTVISNFYYGFEWGLTDFDGISQLASNAPLKVKKDGELLQVYTDAFFVQGGSLAIPYYYLSDQNKVPGFSKVAGTHVGGGTSDLGDVIAFSDPGLQLLNGYTTQARICFFGLSALENGMFTTDFWTNNSEQLFQECLGFVGAECSNDIECNDNNDLTIDVCENPSTIQAQCVNTPIECNNDSDCDDSNNFTQDICLNPGTIESQCVYENIECLSDLDCDDSDDHTLDICENPGSVESQCLHQPIECLNDSDCDDSNDLTIDVCENPGQVISQCINTPIVCNEDNDCDDSDERTIDQCINPGELDSSCRNTEVNCLVDSDCGETGYSGDNFCSQESVVRNFQNATCNNPGTLDSSCSVDVSPVVIEICSDVCVSGACEQIECNNDSECDDLNDHTFDQCLNPGTITSECTHTPIECLDDSDCDDSDIYTQDTCKNPGTVESQCKHDPIACFNDGDCDDANDLTLDSCENSGTTESQCVNDPVQCVKDSDCDDSNVYTEDSCVDYQCVNEVIECFDAADCGVDSESDPFCSENDVVKEVTSYNCLNPGTSESSCKEVVEEELVNSCEDLCSEGNCVDVTCYSDSECDDSNERTVDQCAFAGTGDSFCRNTVVNCVYDSDCGETGFVDGEFCFGADIYHDYKTANCENAGTLESYCKVDVSPIEIEQCDDGNSSTIDSCVEDPYVQCINEEVVCDENADCGEVAEEFFCKGDNKWVETTSPICDAAGTAQSSCSEDVDEFLVEECAFGCSDGECLPAECYVDSDCGDVEVTEQCLGDDLKSITETPVCNAGICEVDRDVDIDECAFGCADDMCLPGECSEDSQCGDVTNNITCEGDNVVNITNTPICSDSFCDETTNKEIVEYCDFGCFEGACVDECTQNSDCGSLSIDNFCVGDDLHKVATIPMCVEGSCEEKINTDIMECEFGCSNGVCNPGVCHRDSDCGNPTTIEMCSGDDLNITTITPVCVDYFCDEIVDNNVTECTFGCADDICLPGECTTDSECGSITETITCDGNNVINITEIPQCLEGSCEENVINETLEYCEFGCFEGECIDECYVDSDCGNPTTTEQCLGDDLKTITETPVCNAGSCEVDRDVNITECTFGCSEDMCLPGECTNDSECGNVQIDNFCVGDDLHVVTVIPQCTEGSCEEDIDEEVIPCDFGCSAGSCNPAECTADSDCGVDSISEMCVGNDLETTTVTNFCIQGMCEQQIEVDSVACEFGCLEEENSVLFLNLASVESEGASCLPEPICFENSDCGEDEFVGEPFCGFGVEEQGLPEDFEPIMGYWHGTNGGRVSLWDENGRVFGSDDGIHFVEVDRSAAAANGLPEDFNPTVGYYRDYNGAEAVVLWDENGDAYGFFNGTWKEAFTGITKEEAGLTEDFVPKVAYFRDFTDPSRTTLFGTKVGELYGRLATNTDPFWTNNSHFLPASDLPLDDVPDVGYSYDFGDVEGVYLWYDGKLFEHVNGVAGFHDITNHLTGLPSGSPDVGYFDAIRRRVVLWYGSEAYESDNGRDFTRFEGGFVLQNFTQFTCNDPTIQDSFCSNETLPTLIEECVGGCFEGECLPVVSICGNGVLESGEQCDDGNEINGDGCSSQCLSESCNDVCQDTQFDFDLVIDRSGSMMIPIGAAPYPGVVVVTPISVWGWLPGIVHGPTKMQVGKVASDVFVDAVILKDDDSRVGVTAFSQEAFNAHSLSRNRFSLKWNINTLFPWGHTSYDEAIRESVDKLVAEGRPGSQKVMVFLSDGRTVDKDKVPAAVQYAKDNDVIIYTIGIGGLVSLDKRILQDMAEETGGKYYYARTLGAARNIYKNLGGETCTEVCSVPEENLNKRFR